MRIHAGPNSPPRIEGLAPPDILVRRSAVLLYAVGIITAQVAAHLGVLPVDNIRLFELLGVIALGATVLTWQLTEQHFNTATLVLTSLTGTVIIAFGVALSGGSESPLWVYYLFPLIFNAFFFRNEITWALLPIILLASMFPAMVDANGNQLLIQLIIIAPMYLAISSCSQILVKGLRRASNLQVMAADTQARLAELDRWSRQLETLHTVSQRISRLVSVDDIAVAIIEHTKRAIPYDTARVYLRQGEALVPAAFRAKGAYGFETRDALALNVGEGLTGWVAKHVRSQNVSDVVGDSRTILVPGAPQEESMLLSPLVHKGTAIGVIVLARLGKSQFSARDLQLLDILAGQTSNAVSKVWNLDAANQQARTDGLTGLLNHRAITERLSTELQLARKQRYPISIAMLDADRFKQINDCHGHLAGNAALQQIAVLLNTYCRASDVAARYGGDEFMLILPNTSARDAVQITRRLIDRISSHNLMLRDDADQQIHVQLSCGVATYPQDGSTIEQLHAVADERLYVSKATRHHLVGMHGGLMSLRSHAGR